MQNLLIENSTKKVPNAKCWWIPRRGESNRNGKNGTSYFKVPDLKDAYSQLKLTAETAKQCNFNIVGGQATGTFRFLTGFSGLVDMPAEFQKAMDRTLNHARNTFCFLNDILIVLKWDKKEHEKLVLEVLKKLKGENFALKLSKCRIFQTEVS